MGAASKDEIQKLDENMKIESNANDEWEWYSPLSGEPFRITGMPWLEQDRVYRRLPLQPSHPIREKIDQLANFTAGVQIRFQTDSPKLAVRVTLADKASMYQMPATGQCGIDCYIGAVGDQRYVNTTRFDPAQVEYEATFFEAFPRQMRDITMNLPLYQGVKELSIGVAPSASVTGFPGFSTSKKVLIYGTSITHGACATRPGMAYSNILSRKLPLEFVNLGFSGNAIGEPELAHLISQIADPALLVLDYEANTPSTERLRESLPEFIGIYRSCYPDVPILVVSQIRMPKEAFDANMLRQREERKQIQQTIVEQLQNEGDINVHFCDGAELLGADYQECTTDSVHPSDLGYYFIAEGLKPVIAKLLQLG